MNALAKVHATYVLGILLAIIVALLTIRWGGIPDLVAYISFALTTTSLLLAVLAIAYSIYANTSLGGTLTSFSASASTFAGTIDSLRIVSADLAAKVELIPTSVEGVARKVEDAHTLIKRLSERADPPPQAPSAPPPPAVNSFVSFPNRASNWGLMALYTAKLAHEKSVGFEVAKVVLAAPYLNGDYAYGFLMASNVAGVLDLKSSHGIITVTDLPATLGESIDTAIANRAITLKTEEAKERFRKAKADLDAYFQ